MRSEESLGVSSAKLSTHTTERGPTYNLYPQVKYRTEFTSFNREDRKEERQERKGEGEREGERESE